MIGIGCDHGGYELKCEIIRYLESQGLEYRDFGCDSTESVDYPVYGKAAKRGNPGEGHGSLHTGTGENVRKFVG